MEELDSVREGVLFYGGAERALAEQRKAAPVTLEKGNTSLKVFPFHKFVLVKRNEQSFRSTAVSIIGWYNETLEGVTMQQWAFGASSARSGLILHFRLHPYHKWNKYERIVLARVWPPCLTICRPERGPYEETNVVCRFEETEETNKSRTRLY